jgi:hypothetical protein
MFENAFGGLGAISECVLARNSARLQDKMLKGDELGFE